MQCRKQECQDDMQDVDAAKQDDGLHGMESDKRPLVNEQEDNSGEPAEYVAKQTCDILLQAGISLLAITRLLIVGLLIIGLWRRWWISLPLRRRRRITG